ncbi:hypothetical protein BSL78_09731 [Apostichopus japonicus]|uniref:Uncharacterized protein n=1 Tax=Stichopus japonicus TaxID=307972 RepID=A0A2G8KZD9_STIJA|nr:hypothetical protein BSL78_09731 [Apostichopus japonicus]
MVLTDIQSVYFNVYQMKPEKDAKQQTGLDLGELQDDPEFQEFLEVHKIGDQKKTWANDAVVGQNLRQAESNVDDDGETAEPMEVNSPDEKEEDTDKSKKKKKKKKKKNKSQDEEMEKEDEGIEESTPVSDMEYLRSKMITKKEPVKEEKDAMLPSSDEDGEAKEVPLASVSIKAKMKQLNI